MNKDEKNKIREMIINLAKEAKQPKDLNLGNKKLNDFYCMINSLPDTKSKLKLLRNVLKEMENILLEKIKKERPTSGKQPIKLWREHIREGLKEISLYKRIERMIQDLMKDPDKFFQLWMTLDESNKEMEKLRKYEKNLVLSKIDNIYMFDFEKIKNKCNTIEDFKEKLNYLEYVKKEYIQNKKYIEDLDKQGDTSFIEKLQVEIDYLKYKFNNSVEKEAIVKNKVQPPKNQNTMSTKHTKAKNRIQWLLGNNDLIEFLNLLKEKNIIAKDTQIPSTIRDCFIDRNGNNIKSSNISKAKSQIQGKTRNYNKIKGVVDEFELKKKS